MQPCSTNYAIIEQIYTSRHAIFKCYCQFLLNDHEIFCMFLNCPLVFHRLFRMNFRVYICNSWTLIRVVLFCFIIIIWCYGKQSTELQTAQTWSTFARLRSLLSQLVFSNLSFWVSPTIFLHWLIWCSCQNSQVPLIKCQAVDAN